ncbi:MAG: AAA family ATPase [Bacteroidia bacterium]
MTEQELQQLHNEIFDFLFDKYLEARARGEEFYFLLGEIQAKNYVFVYFWDTYKNSKLINSSYTPFRLFLMGDLSNGELYLFTPMDTNLTEEDKVKAQTEYDNFLQKMGEEPKTLVSYQFGDVIREYDVRFIKEKTTKLYHNENTLLLALQGFLTTDRATIDTYFGENDYNVRISFDRFMESVTMLRTNKVYNMRGKFQEHLTYSFRNIRIYNYKAIKDLVINDIPDTTQWIFFTGENGHGKTLILQAIAVGLYGNNNEDGQILINQENYLETGYTNYQGAYHCTFSDKYEEGQIPAKRNINAHGKLALLAYGSNRTFSDNKSKGTILHLFDDSMGLPFLAKEWFTIGLNDLPKKQVQFMILKEKLAALGLTIELNKEKSCLLFSQTTFEGETFENVRFEELSSSYKNLFLLISDIILKFTTHKERADYSPMDDISDVMTNLKDKPDIQGLLIEKSTNDVLSGIVIIDEFELHLHPKMQRFLVEKLTELFPKVQFIVSTHSPIPLLGAPKNSVIFHVDRDKERGIFVERLDDKVDFHKLLPNALLSSPIFGFDNFLNRNDLPYYKFSSESDYNETVFDKMLDDKLAKLALEGGKKLEDILKKK